MNEIVAALAIVAAGDLPQRLRQLRDYPQHQRAAVAAGLVAVGIAVAALATPLLDALNVTAPNLQIGAGMVLVLWSVAAFFRWTDDPAPPAVAAGLVPGLFPLVLTPALGVLLLAVGARAGVAWTVLGAAVAAAVLIMPAAVVARVATRTARLASATVGVVLGIALMVDGVLAV